jgi:ATP-dependent RNA helicase DHX37/DHR1
MHYFLLEDVVFHKTCKIHRQLPPGGILVFLTGKQEIVRMVNRLRRALKDHDRNTFVDEVDVINRDNDIVSDDFVLRDMDDDEMDGDLWQVSREVQEQGDDENDDDSSIPKDRDMPLSDTTTDTSPNLLKTIILPLYSLLSTQEQARVFAPVPNGYRLIVVATNIAETSVTIPGMAYVVDCGRQKCRNYTASTGVASYDVMWISKAAADQRAGRAGRTGPGHCYRLYSSSLYSRHMDPFALPEVLTRPLEDVILAMKAMKVSNVNDFPFPTPPDRSQIDAAIQLLANVGCVDISMMERDGEGDGVITRLGSAVAKLPLGVRCSKILLVAAEAGVLDYAIPIVAALSEVSPFIVKGQSTIDMDSTAGSSIPTEEEVDAEDISNDNTTVVKSKHRWSHPGGDVLAAMLAVGAYTYAGRGAGGISEKLACQKFCNENGLHPVIMERIQQMRRHLSHLAKSRLSNADGVAAKTGGYVCSMPPPNKVQEQLLCQSIASGLLDNVAMLAPLGSIPGQHPFSLRSAYLSCSSNIKEPLFIDTNSVVHSRDARRLPKWICYESLIRKTLKDGQTSIAIMKQITPIDPAWLGRLADGSRLLKIGEPLVSPLPTYDENNDVVLCGVRTKFGCYGWELPPVRRDMYTTLQQQSINSCVYMPDDSFRWFARFLLEGKVFLDLKDVVDTYNDHPSMITRRSASGASTSSSHVTKVTLLVSALSNAGIDNAAALRKHWAENDSKFLFNIMKRWVKPEHTISFQKVWIKSVKENAHIWKSQRGTK